MSEDCCGTAAAALCGGCAIFCTTTLSNWCMIKRYGGGSKTGGSTGCCGSCFDKSFDEDNFEENLRRDAEKAKSRELHTQPEAAKDMVVNGDTVK